MVNQFYNNVKTALLLGLLTALILLIGSFWGQQGIVMALIFAAVMNFGSYFFSDKIALATMRAEEVGPEHKLYGIVEELTQRAGLPMPRVYVSPAMAPNAFATGRNPHHAAVCVTAGLLQLLDRNEIMGVVGHELTHVRNRDILTQTVAATIGGAISMLGYMFMWGGGSRSRDGESSALAGLAVLIVGPIAAGLIQSAISRSRELNADSGGAQLCGNPMYLASALVKIESAARRMPLNVNPAFNALFIAEPLNAMQTMATLFATHPPLEKRLINLIGRATL
jgi:heat shock protein HtpX